MNVAWKPKLFDRHRDNAVAFMADLQAFIEVGQIPTDGRSKYIHFCKLHFSDGNLWELRAFTQRSKRCRAFEGIARFIEQYNGDQSIIFVTSCPLELFQSGKIKSDYLGWLDIRATIREALRTRRHMFGLQYLSHKKLRHTIKILDNHRNWDQKMALAAKAEASAQEIVSQQSKS